MKTSIEIIQHDHDKTDYLKEIVHRLNVRFTTQEVMEQRWELHCLAIATELNGTILVANTNEIVFDFTD
jgi:hypothetical protein